MDDISKIWSDTLKIYKNTCSDKIIYDSYFAPLEFKQVNNNEIIITTPLHFNLEYIKPEKENLEMILNGLTQEKYRLTFLTEDDYSKRLPKPRKELNQINNNLENLFTFDNFVVGKSNQQAQAACFAVANHVGKAYNPLFIYSQPGLGKTHLINAIGNYVIDQDSSALVHYTTSESFLNHYVESIGNNEVKDFNNYYRSLDLLLIDDIQFLSSKEGTNEVLFNIFNELKSRNKQIVITSDKQPKELKGIEQRLISRFMQGLVVSIDAPEFETAKAILKKKSQTLNIATPIAEEVYDYIAINFNKDVRELEGALTTLLFQKLLMGNSKDVIDMECARLAYKDIVVEKKDSEITVDYIKKIVANYYKISVEQIDSNTRISKIANARHICMYLCKELIKSSSYNQLGKEFNRNHTTVMKGHDKIQNQLKTDKNLQQAINELKQLII